MNELIFCDVLQQLSERFAQRENFSEVGGGEIGAGVPGARSFSADLNHADYFVARENRRADNFLNCFAGIDTAGFYTFKDSCVTRRGKTVVDLGTAFANGARSERGIARQRNEANIAQSFWEKKIKMTPLLGKAEDAYFFRFDVEIASNALGDGSPRDRWRFGASVRVAKRVAEAFQFRDRANESSRGEL